MRQARARSEQGAEISRVADDERPSIMRQAAICDLSQRQLTDGAAWARDEGFRQVVEAIADGIVIHQDDHIVYANPMAAQQLGAEAPSELVGRSIFDFIVPEDRQLVAERNRVIYEGGEPSPLISFRRVRLDGSLIEAESIGVRISWQGRPAILGTIRDVTARRRIESALQASEERLRQLIEIAPEGVLIHQDGRIVYANRASAAQLGASDPAEVVGRGSLEFVAPVDRSRIEMLFTDLCQNGGTSKLTPFRRIGLDGRLTYVESIGVGIDWNGRAASLSFVRDMTERKRIEAALRASEQRFRQVIEAAPDGILIHQDQLIAYANPAATEQFGAKDASELIGRPVVDFIAPEDRPMLLERNSRIYDNGGPSPLVGFRRQRLDGRLIEVEAIGVKITWEGRPAILGMVRDVTERKRIEIALRESKERYQQLMEHAPDAILAQAQRRIVFANGAAVRLSGAASADDLLGSSPLDLCHGDTRERAHSRIEDVERGVAAPMNLEGRLCGLDGREIDVEWTSIPFTFEGQPAEYSVIRDITERIKAEERNRYLASHDTLTDLPNRFSFQDRLKAALVQAKRRRRRVAVHYLDLDSFKDVNDTLGHPVGDQLLRLVAARLHQVIRDVDTIARLGGDEFAVIQTDVDGAGDVAALAQKLLDTAAADYDLEEHRLHSSATIGIAVYPDDDDDPDELLRKADVALYQAKAQGRNVFSFFTDDLNERIQERKQLLTDLSQAVRQDEFLIYFQPIADLESGRIAGVEALLRWQHPKRGLLAAESFIDVADASREALPLGEWVLRSACAQARSWQQVGLAPLRLAVNLSMNQLKRPDLVELIESILADTGFNPELLEIEVTESVMLTAGAAEVAASLRRLRELGVQIALDDFGTGYSSLTFLKRFPVGRIKIDRSFVRGLGVNSEDSAIVRAVINLGRSLNMGVTAEGVEGQTSLDLLRAEGCHEQQGYYLAPPMPSDQFVRFLLNYAV